MMSSLKLSVLDQSTVHQNETAQEALQHTVELAKMADEKGFHRFWVAEHHNMKERAGSSPEVLISYLLAQTKQIKIGSGGVMLQHYSPYKVAENFNVLASLAPGRVDLGVGKSPGGLPVSTATLQKGVSQDHYPFTEKIKELALWLHNQKHTDEKGDEIRAYPLPPVPADLILLGTSKGSAELAAKLGVSFVFAQFINSDEQELEGAIEAFQQNVDPHVQKKPVFILALPVITAETNEEAKSLISNDEIVKVHLKSGKTFTLASEENAREFGNQSGEPYEIKKQERKIIFGTQALVREELLALQKKLGIDEFIILTPIDDAEKRKRSLVLLKDAFHHDHAETLA